MSTAEVKLLPHQIEYLQSDTNTMLVAGFGSGKSHAGVMKTIIQKLKYPQHRVAVYLPTYNLIRDVSLPIFTEALANLNIKFKLNKVDKTISIPNNSQILFRTLSEPELIIGYETAYSWIDEADLVPKDKMELAYNKILGRNRSINNALIDTTSTPEGFKWLYEQSQSGRWNVIRAKTTDNKFLPASYIKQLKEQYPEELLSAYLNGEFVNLTSGSVYNHYNRKAHDTQKVVQPRDLLHIGQDFNVGGCCSAVFVLDHKGDPHLVDEFTSSDTYDIIAQIQERYPKHSNITIYPDASGYQGKTNASMSDIELLQRSGFNINAPKRNGKVQDRVNAVNLLLQQDRFKVNTKKCPNIARALEQQAYDASGQPEKFAGASTNDDWNDAMGYFLVRKFGIIEQRVAQQTLKFG